MMMKASFFPTGSDMASARRSTSAGSRPVLQSILDASTCECQSMSLGLPSRAGRLWDGWNGERADGSGRTQVDDLTDFPCLVSDKVRRPEIYCRNSTDKFG